MASLTRVNLLRNISRYTLVSSKSSQIRYISTSKKNRDTATVASEKTVCDVDLKKNWMSYGFSHDSYEEDRHFTHVFMFVGVTLLFCLGGFIFAYKPIYVGNDWAQREAFLELRRREELGLPLIDRDFLPVSKIILPSDEELGDAEIIV